MQYTQQVVESRRWKDFPRSRFGQMSWLHIWWGVRLSADAWRCELGRSFSAQTSEEVIRATGMTKWPTSSPRHFCPHLNDVYFISGYTYSRLRSRHICIQYSKLWIKIPWATSIPPVSLSLDLEGLISPIDVFVHDIWLNADKHRKCIHRKPAPSHLHHHHAQCHQWTLWALSW